MKVFRKTDKFYPVFGVVVIITTILLIHVFRSIFSTLGTAYEVDIKIPDSELRINKGQLNEAHDIMVNKEIVELEVR
jgi:hypothetical protein